MSQIVERVRDALLKRRAEERDGCNAPREIDHCEEGNCWCRIRSDGDARAAIAVSDAALAEAGYAIRPREPDAEMITAGGDAMRRTTRPLNNALEAWRAMWDAAPKPEAE